MKPLEQAGQVTKGRLLLLLPQVSPGSHCDVVPAGVTVEAMGVNHGGSESINSWFLLGLRDLIC